MLEFIGEGKSHNCNGTTRRDFLRVGAVGAVGLSLPQYLWAKEAGVLKPDQYAKACIMIFNLGAPSQLDTFDMKPDAPREVRGPFEPISTNADFQISEILPMHAKIADKFSLVRSCYHTSAAVHDAGWQMMQTGRQFAGGIESPHVGSVVSFLNGTQIGLTAVCGIARTHGAWRWRIAQRSGGWIPGQISRPFRPDGRSLETQFQGSGFTAAGRNWLDSNGTTATNAGNCR